MRSVSRPDAWSLEPVSSRPNAEAVEMSERTPRIEPDHAQVYGAYELRFLISCPQAPATS